MINKYWNTPTEELVALAEDNDELTQEIITRLYELVERCEDLEEELNCWGMDDYSYFCKNCEEML